MAISSCSGARATIHFQTLGGSAIGRKVAPLWEGGYGIARAMGVEVSDIVEDDESIFNTPKYLLCLIRRKLFVDPVINATE